MSELGSKTPCQLTRVKKKLETRKSAQYLVTLEGEGVLDSRSELGTVIDLAEWERKSLIRFHCSCEHIKDNAEFVPSHIMVTDTHLYILRYTDKRDQLVVRCRRPLKTIMKITTKARMGDSVKLQYGSKGRDGTLHITDSDRLHIPDKAGLAISAIKSALLPPSPQRRQSTQPLSSYSKRGRDRRPSLIAEHGQSTPDELDISSLRLNSRRPSTSLINVSADPRPWRGYTADEDEKDSDYITYMRRMSISTADEPVWRVKKTSS